MSVRRANRRSLDAYLPHAHAEANVTPGLVICIRIVPIIGTIRIACIVGIAARREVVPLRAVGDNVACQAASACSTILASTAAIFPIALIAAIVTIATIATITTVATIATIASVAVVATIPALPSIAASAAITVYPELALLMACLSSQFYLACHVVDPDLALDALKYALNMFRVPIGCPA